MSANDMQVGGDHYKQPEGLPQHWDLAIMYQWDPFQYQITKYVMRWKDKHPDPQKKLEDLKKGLHFYQKYIENWERYLTHMEVTVSEGEPVLRTLAEVPTVFDMKDIQVEGYIGAGLIDFRCKKCKVILREPSVQKFVAAHNGSGACTLTP
jgi:hypothetical protein